MVTTLYDEVTADRIVHRSCEEQELIRSIKTTGGLKRGRGMIELQRAKWLLSTPSYSNIKRSMDTLTKINHATSEQHKAAGPSRIKRDYNDAMKMVKFLVERDPFDDNIHLMNIDTGEVADVSVNVYNAKQIGDGILKNMVGKHIFDYNYKRKDMAVTITANHSLKHDGENVQIKCSSNDC